MNSIVASSQGSAARPGTSPAWIEDWVPRLWPELTALALTAASGGPLWHLGILASLIRLAWCTAELVHGAGHMLLRVVVDRAGTAIRLVDVLEHRSPAGFAAALVPLRPIGPPDGKSLPIPWTEVGGQAPWAVRLKASGGVVLNLAAVGLAAHVLLGLPAQAALWSRVLVASVMATNAWLLLASRTDWAAMVSGRAVRFHCGNFGFISCGDRPPPGELLSKAAIERFVVMAQETEIRGAQSGGGLVLVGDRDGRPRMVGHKLVNAKRGHLSRSLEGGFRRRRCRAARAGCRPLSAAMVAAWHFRFATSAPPTVRETHWHEWTPLQRRPLWRWEDGRWRRIPGIVQHRITHNGDFEAFRLFASEVDIHSLGRWLDRVLPCANPALGDSPKIAGMMDLLICQGDWFASVRWAHLQVFAGDSSLPSQADLQEWAELFEAAFLDGIGHPSGSGGEGNGQSTEAMTGWLLPRLGQDPRLIGGGILRIRRWIQKVIDAFLHNDPYRAARQFMDGARGSFGLVVVSSTCPDRLVLCSLGQPIAVGFDPAGGLAVYASEPAAVDAVLAKRAGAYRIDLDPNAGEIAVLSAADLLIHSMSLGRELTPAERGRRRLGYGPSSWPGAPRPGYSERPDPVADDLADIPGLLARIKDDWINPGSDNRQSAELLAQFLIAKAAHLEDKQEVLLRQGLDPALAQSRHVDLLITGVENSLWLGERFARDLSTLMPLLTVRALSANVVLERLQHDVESLHLARQSILLVLSHSGQTFASRQVAEACDLLVRQGVIREFFLLIGEPTSLEGSPLLTPRGSGEPFCRRLFTSGAGRRTAEPATATVAAMHQTLTELLFCLCRQVQQALPGRRPLGMQVEQEDLLALESMEDHLFLEDVRQIVGADGCGLRRPSGLSRRLIRSGRRWAFHVLEAPIAWLIQALYIAISVGWGVPLFRTAAQLGVGLAGLEAGEGVAALLLAASVLADVALYIFGPWCWTVALRLTQGRQPLARTGRRVLVIGEAEGVHQLLSNYVSKLFALSFGIAALEVHGADPGDHLLHGYAHRVVRGTLLFLGVPDGRCSELQHSRGSAVILAARQADGIRHLRTGPEIVAVSSDPRIDTERFTAALVLPSPIHAGCSEGQRPPSEDLIEAIRESRFGSFRRLLAAYVFFWAMARRVARFPVLRYAWWKSQSRTKVMTTASPVSAARLDRAEPQEILQLDLMAIAHREQS